jgi:RNA polymerase sigma-70 factor (ECF subfamily)
MADIDVELMEQVRKGDRAALEKLLSRHQAQIFRFGTKMCRNEEDAKDVLQETLLAAARTAPEFRGGSAVTTWLYAIARSFCIKKRRTSKFAPDHIESLDDHREAAHEVADHRRTPEEDTAGRQLQVALDDAIAALDPMYREVLVLRDVEGLAAAEVAEIMGLTVEAVKSRLHRARMTVREKVAPLLGVPGVEPAAEASVGPGCQDVAMLFSQRLEGEIDSGACAELEKHLQSCTACKSRCDSLRQTLAMCKRAGAAPVPADVERSVRDALRRFLAQA